MSATPLIKEGDFVFINGGGAKRIAEVKKDLKVRLGRSGAACTDTLIGLRFGEVVRLNHSTKSFIACNEYPDLDISDLHEVEEKDNRNLVDNNSSQLLSNNEVAAIREEKGIDGLLTSLVESSTTFQSKTKFSKEKYLRKKQKKYGTLFKVERVTPDTMAETHLPTINPSDDLPDDARCIRLRADTVALIAHHSGIHASSRTLLYDRTNGVLAAYLLTRLGDLGRIYQIFDKAGQPNMFHAKQLGVEGVKERWKAVPRNPGFLEGIEEEASPTASPEPASAEGSADKAAANTRTGPSQWVKGIEARTQLQEQPADSIVVVDDDHPERALADLLPFLAYGGHIVVYSPFLEDLTALFLKLRNDCVNIRISETWYRHHQVLPQRTHPTVNMSTAAGYLLTAIKVQRNPNPRPRFTTTQSLMSTSPVPASASSNTQTSPATTEEPKLKAARLE